MKKNTDGNILVYVVILVIITIFVGMVLFNNSKSLNNYKKIENIDTILANSIYYKAKLAIKYDKLLNANGTGFLDNLSCPNNVTMSGTLLKTSNINTSLVSPTITSPAYCLGSYNANIFKIYFNNDFTNFSGALYLGETVLVNTALNPYEAQFSDSDNTLMTFTNTPGNDNIDDNFNSDNYKNNSTGSINYPNNSNGKKFGDDDSNARKIAYSYVYPKAGFTNIFWNNSETNKFIKNNINNDDTINSKIGDTTNGILYFDIDKKMDLKIVEFSKTRFDTTGELFPLSTYNYSSTGGTIGYLQKDVSDNLSFSDISTPNDFIFDFKNDDYAVFMNNTGTGTIFYKIKGYDKSTGSGLYMVPLDDSNNIVIKYLGAGIIKKGGDYIYKIVELVGEK